MNEKTQQGIEERSVQVLAGKVSLEGNLVIPKDARSIVLFAHGSGSSRLSPRNRYVAEVLHKERIATLLFDLLTTEEEVEDNRTGKLRFNIRLLADRLGEATNWTSVPGNASSRRS